MIGDWRLSNGVKPDRCKTCPRYARGQGFVPCDGPPDADILTVGRSPGKSEASTGRPYSGGAGDLLNSILFRAGLNRVELLITNLVKCFAEGDPTPAEISFCQQAYLVEELVNRKCIVTMGSLPGYYLASVDKVRRERGTVRMLGKTPVVVTLEPAGLLWSKSEAKNLGETRDYLPIVIKDYVKAKRIAQGKAHVTQDRQLLTAPTSDQVKGIIQSCMERKTYALDIETAGKGSNNITIIGLCPEPGYAVSIKDWRLYHAELQDLFGRLDCTMSVHNDQFDPPMLTEHAGFDIKNRRYDTMLASHLVESDMGDFGLEATVSRHLDYVPWKEEGRKEADYWLQRNVRDVSTTRELESVLTARMDELEVIGLFWKHQMPMSQLCHDMTKSGINVNEEKMLKTGIACRRLEQKAELALTDLHGGWFNPRSPMQLKEVLYDKLKLPIQHHRRTRKPTTDHYALEDLERIAAEQAQRYPKAKETIEAVLNCRRFGKLANTFSSGEYVVEGRVHPSYLQHRAVTGRQSSQGPNMHQVPKGLMREMYVPDSVDDIFIEADYSQIEMRLGAWFSRCEKMLAMFAAGVDIHLENAKRFYGMIDPGETRRSLAKNMYYGIQYGQGKSGLAVMYGCEVSHAESFINFIFGEYPELKRWRTGLLNTVEIDNYLRNPYSRIRWLWNKNFATEAFIYLPQSTGYDVLAESAIELAERLPFPARICLMVHDSIMVHTPAELRDEVSTLMKEVMERPRPLIGDLSFPIKMGAGDNYDKASHEEGLAGDWRRLRRTTH